MLLHMAEAQGLLADDYPHYGFDYDSTIGLFLFAASPFAFIDTAYFLPHDLYDSPQTGMR